MNNNNVRLNTSHCMNNNNVRQHLPLHEQQQCKTERLPLHEQQQQQQQRKTERLPLHEQQQCKTQHLPLHEQQQCKTQHLPRNKWAWLSSACSKHWLCQLTMISPVSFSWSTNMWVSSPVAVQLRHRGRGHWSSGSRCIRTATHDTGQCNTRYQSVQHTQPVTATHDPSHCNTHYHSLQHTQPVTATHNQPLQHTTSHCNTHTHARTHPHNQSHTPTHTHAHTHAHTRVHPHTHTQACTRAHTHTMLLYLCHSGPPSRTEQTCVGCRWSCTWRAGRGSPAPSSSHWNNTPSVPTQVFISIAILLDMALPTSGYM